MWLISFLVGIGAVSLSFFVGVVIFVCLKRSTMTKSEFGKWRKQISDNASSEDGCNGEDF